LLYLLFSWRFFYKCTKIISTGKAVQQALHGCSCKYKFPPVFYFENIFIFSWLHDETPTGLPRNGCSVWWKRTISDYFNISSAVGGTGGAAVQYARRFAVLAAPYALTSGQRLTAHVVSA
jgi:hypothetical protein